MDVGTATVVGGLVGGILTVLGGLLATVWLARREEDRERSRQRKRHATAVRIVVLELMGIGASHVLYGYMPLGFERRSTAGYERVAPDLYGLLPDPLARDVALVYSHAGDPGSAEGAKLIAAKIIEVLKTLRTYGETELGLTFQSADELDALWQKAVNHASTVGR
jgi:hypothetical protein